MNYAEFLEKKSQLGTYDGFEPIFMPDYLFDFQKSLVEWACLKGKSAIFADCGLGKTPMQLVWAENVVRKTNKNVLIITPLAVSYQTIREGNKFGIGCFHSKDGKPKGKITVTNYESLPLFNQHDFIGVVCDESSILKNFDGTRKSQITEFMKKLPYRLCCTATAAPNDYIELGTTSESLGELGFMDMLNRFFKNDQNNCSIKRHYANQSGGTPKWRFKHHAQRPFWQWVTSWARALRRPSDLGFSDDRFILPELIEKQTVIANTQPLPGELFVRPAIGLDEQRKELRLTMTERCETAASLVRNNGIAVVWCHLNDEGDLLERLIPDSVQVSGKDLDDKKEAKLNDFSNGNIRVLITKPKIACFGMNWQHCSHMTFFPSHSFEQYYQAIRRCWRFGQKNPVTVDIITTGGGEEVLKNLQRKSEQANTMFSELVAFMNESLTLEKREFNKQMEAPAWL